jgi:hypothetical protein
MEKEQLVSTLNQLHAELSKAQKIDRQTLALLETLTQDIQQLLERSTEPTEQEKEPVAHGLHDLLLRFEAEHPQLSVMLGRIADGLSRMGI